MSTREERIAAYIKANEKSPAIAFMAALVAGPLGYMYVSLAVGAVLCLIIVGIAILMPPPSSLIVGAIFWVLAAIMAPFDAMTKNKALRVKAELMAPEF